MLSRVAIFLLSLATLAQAADPDFVIYRVQGRPADELVKIASGLLGNKLRMRAMDDKIIIYGTEAESKTALQLFRELDHGSRQYRVYVRSKGAVAGRTSAVAAEVDGGIGSVQVKKRSGVIGPGGRGSVSVGGASVVGQAQDYASQGNDGSFVVVSEGQEAGIGTANGALPSGMQVKLRALGKRGVHLEIFQTSAQGSQTQGLNTKLDLPLNVWRSLGSLEQSGSGSQNEILGGASQNSSSQRSVEVKVQLVPEGQ